jgi:23S rRNA pseudouridine1911/1915/1917 synthase
MVESGKVSVDGTECRDPARTLAAGADLVIAWNRPGTGRAQRAAMASVAEAGLAILREDPWYIAVDKPPGLLTDAATREQRRERDTVVHRLRTYLAPQGKRPFPAHRIDRDTSGAVLLAKDERTHAALRAQFHAHLPTRVYLAVLQGVPATPAGTWEDWMAWDDALLIQRQVAPESRGAVLATASWTLVKELPAGLSLVEVRLGTGRRNQIRLHAMLRGMPLLGERMYLPERFERRGPRIERHALHAWKLGFTHPVDRSAVQLEAPVPADLRAVIG